MELKELDLQGLDQDMDLVAADEESSRIGERKSFEQLEGEEVPSLRGESTKQYDLGENRYQAVLFPEPVHFMEAGEWKEIDNSLDEGEDGGRKVLRNRANALMCELPSVANEGALVKLKSGKHGLSWEFERQALPVQAELKSGAMLKRERLIELAKAEPMNAKRDPASFTDEELIAFQSPEDRRCDTTEKTSQVLYNGILTGIDVRYTLSGDQLKEDIICANRDALANVALKLPSEYEYLINEDRSLSVRDAKTGAERFYFDMPVVYDACGMTVIGTPVLEARDGYTRLSYEIDSEFLAVCAYPVTIDPVAKLRGTSTGVKAVYVNLQSSSTPSSAAKNSTNLYVGKNGTGSTAKYYASLLKFTELVQMKASDTVVSATLKMSVATPSKSKGHFVGAYAIKGNWDVDTVTGQSIDSMIADKPMDYAAGGKGTMSFDITNLYREWYLADNHGGGLNHGIALKCIPNSQKYFALKSPRTGTKSKKPLMTVNYISHAGLESWWKYESQSAGRAGTTHVDLFNGNVVHEHQDTAMTGNRMPVSIAHYYNSCQSATGSYYRQVPDDDETFDPGSYQAMYRCGQGWKHSGLQFIYQKKINSKPYFIWVDGDGTEHWFKNDSKWYECECYDMEGMGLKLNRYASTNKLPPRIEIEDQSHTKMIFRNRPTKKWMGKWKHHWLWRVEDAILDKDDKHVNVTKYTYKLPEETKDGLGSSKAMRAMEGWLLKVTDPAGRETRFSYDSETDAKLLTSIQTPDDYDEGAQKLIWRTVSFLYDGEKRLTGINYSDLDGETDIQTPNTQFTYYYDVTNVAQTNLLETAKNYDGLFVTTKYERVKLGQPAFDVDESVDDNEDEETGGTTTDDPYVQLKGEINYELCRAGSLETAKGTAKGAMQLFKYMNCQTSVQVVDGDAPAETDKKIVYQFNDKGNVTSIRDELGFAQFVKYDGSEGNENKPTESSKMQKAVVNLVRNVDFSQTNKTPKIDAAKVVWTLFEANPYVKPTKKVTGNPNGNLVSIDETADGQCLNLHSVKLERRSNSGSGDSVYARQTLNNIELGKVYTFSAYVKADDIAAVADKGGYVQIAGAGAPTLIGPQIIENTEDDLEAGLPTDGWDRYRIVYDTTGYTGTANITIDIKNDAQSGTVWFAAPQFEEGYVANSVNMLSNADFRLSANNTTYPGVTRQFPADWKAGKNVDADFKTAYKKAKNDLDKVSSIVKNMTKQVGVKERNADTDALMPKALAGKYLQMCDRPRTKSLDTFFYQDLDVSGKKNQVFFVGGWADAQAMPGSGSTKNDKCCVRMTVKFYCKPKGKTSYKWYTGKGGKVPFSAEWVGWQAAGGAVAAPHDYSQVRVYLVAKGQPNRTRFSNIFLFREEFGKSYRYDKNKNMTDTGTLSGQQAGMEYDKEHNLIRYRKPGRPKSDKHKYKMSYGAGDKKKQHLLYSMTTPEGMVTKASYDAYGNKDGQRVTKEKATAFVKTKTSFDATRSFVDNGTTLKWQGGNYALRRTDARGKEAAMSLNLVNGQLDSATDPNLTTVNYLYDKRKRLTRVFTKLTQDKPDTYRNDYTYDTDGRLQTVSHNTDLDPANDVTYHFEYDALGAQTQVRVGDRVLSSNEYAQDRSHKLKKSVFGTNDTVENEYDEFDRIAAVKLNGETRYSYQYGANGQAAYLTDHKLGRRHITEFDLAMRPKRSTTMRGNEILYRATLKYDKLNHLTSFGEQTAGNETHLTSFEYDKDDRTTEVAYDDDNRKDDEIERGVKYEYNSIGGVKTKTVYNAGTTHEVAYKHVMGGHGEDSRSPLIESISQPGLELAYAYDEVGNIVKETRNGVEIAYGYDRLGQLIRVNDPTDTTVDPTGTTWLYEYDLGGNILLKRSYPLTADAIDTVANPGETSEYAYDDPSWKDKLGSYNGDPIQYDAIGNPLFYKDLAFEWKDGRKLARLTRGQGGFSQFGALRANADMSISQITNGAQSFALNSGELSSSEPGVRLSNGKALAQVASDGQLSVDYTYNAAGLRIQKVVNNLITYDYFLHGKLISHMTVTGLGGVDNLHFYYDAASRPQMVKFNGEYFTYGHNLQGDIVAILDSNGNRVVEYAYDTWGKPIGDVIGDKATTLGKLNPFRYRGYVFDEETGFYYLRSRYYNPNWGRFINEDILLGQAGKLFSHNVFAYCNANPVMYHDPTGRLIWPFEQISQWFHGKIDEEIAKRPNVNEKEKAYAHSEPWNAYLGASYATRAENLGKAIFGKHWDDDDIDANAFRHCVWNIIMAMNIDEMVAETIATNHEDGQLGTEYNDNATMDLHNNEVGRSLGRGKNIFDVGRFTDSSEYSDFVEKYPKLEKFAAVDIYPAYLAMQALNAGQLKINKQR